MGLNLKGTPATSNATIKRTKRALDLVTEIREEIAAMGIHPYPQPKTAPTPLSDLDVGSLSNRELETHMTNYVAYAQYVGPKLAETEAAYKVSGANLKAVAASQKVSLMKDGIPKNQIDSRVTESQDYAEAELEYLKLYAIKQVLASYYKSYSRQASALSRIVELRKLEYEQDLRQHNVARYKPGHERPRAGGGVPGNLRR
jgi:hypothetical protein